MGTVLEKSKTAECYRDLDRSYPIKRRLRSTARDMAVFLLSLSSSRKSGRSRECIRFPFYHHVFADERAGFARHLRYMRNHGDFISIDEAVNMLEKRERIGGRYFCVTLDDGFKNCVTNALPILIEEKCDAAFFIPTDYIGRDFQKDADICRRFFETSSEAYPVPVEFLDWNDCRKLIEAGMSVGSHTCSHTPIKGLAGEKARSELTGSRRKIEEELKVECRHFSCPWGSPERDFDVERGPLMAKESGYRSFFTTERGPNLIGTDVLRIKRDHMLAGWKDYQLRYFFGNDRVC